MAVLTKHQQRMAMSHREKSTQHEKRVARKLVKLTPNSGAGNIKGDIQTKEYLIEHKFTDKGQFILFLDMLMKTREQAFRTGKRPKWILTIQGQDFTLFEGVV